MIKITALSGVWEVERLDRKIRADGKVDKLRIEEDGRRWIVHLAEPVDMVLVSGEFKKGNTEEEE